MSSYAFSSLAATPTPRLLIRRLVLLAVDLEGLALKVDRHVLAPGVNLLQQILKGKLDLVVRHCACLHKFHVPVLCAKLLGLLLRYLPGSGIVFD